MVIFIFLLLFILLVVSIFAWIFKEASHENSERKKHEKNLAVPFRVVRCGTDKYRIQGYHRFTDPDSPKEYWNWETLIGDAMSLTQVKQRFCELLAKQRFEAEEAAKAEAERLKGAKEFMDGLQVHDIVDMSDCNHLCEQIIQKLREAAVKKQEPVKRKTRKKKVEDGSAED